MLLYVCGCRTRLNAVSLLKDAKFVYNDVISEEVICAHARRTNGVDSV